MQKVLIKMFIAPKKYPSRDTVPLTFWPWLTQKPLENIYLKNLYVSKILHEECNGPLWIHSGFMCPLCEALVSAVPEPSHCSKSIRISNSLNKIPHSCFYIRLHSIWKWNNGRFTVQIPQVKLAIANSALPSPEMGLVWELLGSQISQHKMWTWCKPM